MNWSTYKRRHLLSLYINNININDYIDILATDKIPGTRNNIPLYKI